MDGGFRNDVVVESVAKVDWVDIVTGRSRISIKGFRGLIPLDGKIFFVRLERPVQWQGRSGFVPFQIAVHYCEEDLQKEIDSIYQHRKQVEPCFA